MNWSTDAALHEVVKVATLLKQASMLDGDSASELLYQAQARCTRCQQELALALRKIRNSRIRRDDWARRKKLLSEGTDINEVSGAEEPVCMIEDEGGGDDAAETEE